MNEIASIAMEAMHNDTQRLERIGVNLANASTPAYRREIAAMGPVSRAELGVTAFGRLLRTRDADASFPQTAAILRDTRPGTLKSTGLKLDVALQSRGYFEVATPDGPAYTRRGEFRVDAKGTLVTDRGWPVMGQGGEMALGMGTDNVVIDRTGQLSSGARKLGQLKVIDFDDAATLQHIDDGYFKAGDGARMVPDAHLSVQQGFLENANVSPAQEMVELMRTMRHFESMSRMLQGYDEMLGGAIRKLGEM